MKGLERDHWSETTGGPSPIGSPVPANVARGFSEAWECSLTVPSPQPICHENSML